MPASTATPSRPPGLLAMRTSSGSVRVIARRFGFFRIASAASRLAWRQAVAAIEDLEQPRHFAGRGDVLVAAARAASSVHHAAAAAASAAGPSAAHPRCDRRHAEAIDQHVGRGVVADHDHQDRVDRAATSAARSARRAGRCRRPRAASGSGCGPDRADRAGVGLLEQLVEDRQLDRRRGREHVVLGRPNDRSPEVRSTTE